MNEFYTVIENQKRSDGTYGLLYDHYYDYEGQTSTALDRAYAKYFTVCAAAAVSDIPYHSAAIQRSDGIQIECKVWDRRTAEQVQAGE